MKVKLTNGAKELERGSKWSTGLDLRARGYSKVVKDKNGKNKITEPVWFNEEITEVIIKPMERILIKTGVSIEPDEPESIEGLDCVIDTTIRPRSGLTLKDGILCQLGSIDVDYRGDLGCSLINLSEDNYTITANQAIGQLCFSVAGIPKIEYVEDLSNTERGAGSGSTGV